MLEIYRYHNPAKCDSNDTAACYKGPADNPRNQKQLRRPCPIWVRGTNPSGKYIRQSLKKTIGYSTRDWNDAARKIHEWEETGSQPEPPDPETRRTIEYLQDMYLADMKSRNLAQDTKRKFQCLFKQFIVFATRQNLKFVDEVTRTHIELFRNSWTDGALTRQKRYQNLRGIFHYALDSEMVTSNPTATLKGIKVKEDSGWIKDFSAAEMRKILDAARADKDKRIYPLALLLRYSGLRISDATMLRCDALKGNQLTIRTIKTNVTVSVTLPTLVVEQLNSIACEHDGYYFWNGRSQLHSLTDLYRDHHLRRVFVAAKVKGTPHMFRHTFVHALLNEGLTMREVAASIGDTVQITEKYYGKWNVREQVRLNERLVEAHDRDELLAALSMPPAAVVSIRRKSTRRSSSSV
jgi:site-specific recombinase XerD